MNKFISTLISILFFSCYLTKGMIYDTDLEEKTEY